MGLDDTSTLFGIATAPLDDLAATLKEASEASVRVVRGYDAGVDELIPVTDEERDVDLLSALSELRLIKDDHEIACLQAAIDATVVGFEDVVRALPDSEGHGERWVEGTFNRRARTEGNDVGYDTIAACGHHACTLHWIRNDGPVHDGDLLLLDAGVVGDELYTADVTRTVPVSGRYSPEQREVYDAVWRAQQAAMAECRPGQPFMAPHRAAIRVLTEWLVEAGILQCSVEEALDAEHRFYTRYTLHGTSHMLGLDVHDCANARNDYRELDLEAGMVLTVEPGCYLQPDDLTVPERYRGIGVRIEDDVLITEDGCRVLSAALPTRADEVEAWMAPLLAAGRD
jgi:Xaa-Pro aminopeptidase